MIFRVFGSFLAALHMPDPIRAAKLAPHAKQRAQEMPQGLSELDTATDALNGVHHAALDPNELQWPSFCETSATVD